MLVIDAHAHIVPKNHSALPLNTEGWPSLHERADGRAEMHINGSLYRVLERAYFDLDTRLANMDADGVDVQVISPLPELLGHWLPASTATALARLLNQVIADAIVAAPGRIEGLGMLPMQDIDAAVAMVPELAAKGLKGIHVGSNINGRSIAEAHFYPVFTALEKHNLAMFVHGLRPAAVERALGHKMINNIIGIPHDCGLAVASFITTDVLATFPKLRIGFAHAGGTIGSVLWRMDHVWHESAGFRQDSSVAPSQYIKKFFFDTITYSSSDLQHCMQKFGVETFICGSDGPAAGAQQNLQKFVEQACLSDMAAVEAVLSKNTCRFLNLDAAQYNARVK